MSMKNYTSHLSTKQTPQSEPVPGREAEQAKNNAGGFVFKITPWERLDRFLILGSEGGTYYVGEKKLTVENAQCVLACAKEDAARTVARIVEISHEGRAPKNDPAIFALALCLKLGPEAARKAARAAVPAVCRIGTHLFQLADAIKALGGWSKGTMKAFRGWFEAETAEGLGYQLVKYQSRGGWSTRDILRKTHPRPKSPQHDALYRWAVKGMEGVQAPYEQKKPVSAKSKETRIISMPTLAADLLPPIVHGFEEAQRCRSEKELVAVLEKYPNLPREALPTPLLTSAKVWERLLMGGHGMPITALIRNLGTMSKNGVLGPLSDAERFVVKKLTDVDVLKKGRVHPLQVLLALKTYAQGRGMRGSGEWTVNQKVADALNQAFYLAFQAVEPTGKRWLLGCDVSGSMSSPVSGQPLLSCLEAVGALALVTAATEPSHHIVGFTSGAVKQWTPKGTQNARGYGIHSYGVAPLDISPSMRLNKVVETMRALPMGATDCALPMLYAKENRIPVDVFCVLTDNETWDGGIHPFQALNDYRQAMGIPAKFIAMGMAATEYSVADPNDSGQMNVVGFDASVPQIMADFARR